MSFAKRCLSKCAFQKVPFKRKLLNVTFFKRYLLKVTKRYRLKRYLLKGTFQKVPFIEKGAQMGGQAQGWRMGSKRSMRPPPTAQLVPTPAGQGTICAAAAVVADREAAAAQIVPCPAGVGTSCAIGGGRRDLFDPFSPLALPPPPFARRRVDYCYYYYYYYHYYDRYYPYSCCCYNYDYSLLLLLQQSLLIPLRLHFRCSWRVTGGAFFQESATYQKQNWTKGSDGHLLSTCRF